jgi:hypothetical protein
MNVTLNLFQGPFFSQSFGPRGTMDAGTSVTKGEKSSA